MVAEGQSTVPRGRHRSSGATRGFLFCDLRGYTSFVDEHGAAAAAELLARYRVLVREVVAGHAGTELATEGDSFYVVFDSVSHALECGLAIVASCQTESAAVEAIRVGVGIHAGETVETPEGFVGQPVNIAARLCALAPAGHVFVSDTVRSLTQSVLDVTFVSRGRRRLKGVAEPVHVYSVEPAGALTRTQRRRLGRPAALVGSAAVAGLAVVALGAAGLGWLDRPPAGLTGEWKIGLSLPLTGDAAAAAGPVRVAVELAVAEANSRQSGFSLVVQPGDDAGGDSGEDASRGRDNAAAFVADQSVIAMIGPWSSFTAVEQIPLTNEAGLLQCSPSNTDPGLTKPRAGALDLRPARPDQNNYVRLPAAADIEAAAGASFVYHDLGSQTALVVDDTQPVGKLVADSFQREFERLGGEVLRRALNPETDPADLLALLDTPTAAPTSVFFGGFSNSGAPEVRQAMVELGHAAVPFMGWDGLWDGSGQREDSFIQLAGEAAAGSYVSHPTVGIVEAHFERRYREARGELPDGLVYDYAAAAYACVEIVAQAVEAASAAGTAPAQLREFIRGHVADGANRFDTVVGDVSFDENGDSLRQIVSFYRADMAVRNGQGDWVLLDQQDFGPAP